MQEPAWQRPWPNEWRLQCMPSWPSLLFSFVQFRCITYLEELLQLTKSYAWCVFLSVICCLMYEVFVCWKNLTQNNVAVKLDLCRHLTDDERVTFVAMLSGHVCGVRVPVGTFHDLSWEGFPQEHIMFERSLHQISPSCPFLVSSADAYTGTWYRHS